MLDFVKLFDLLMQQTKAKALDIDNHEGNKFEQVKTILSNAVDAYHSLCTASKWHVSKKSNEHFNVACENCDME